MYRNLLIWNWQQFYLVDSGEIDVGTIEVQLIHATDKNEKKTDLFSTNVKPWNNKLKERL